MAHKVGVDEREAFPESRQTASQVIYRPDTRKLRKDKTEPRTSKQNVNGRAKRENEEHRTCLWMKGEHREREKVERKTVCEEHRTSECGHEARPKEAY